MCVYTFACTSPNPLPFTLYSIHHKCTAIHTCPPYGGHVCRALSDWEIAGFGSLGLGIWEGLSGGTNHDGRTGPNEQAATATVRDDRLRRARGVAGLGIPGYVQGV